ncbi:hypothetical protein CHARACLAT_023637 [Characodon lateralis]|uniref:Uncharacterized protein n=1 Tax=Characodon lateralis TaxID=208331 RepID=A0ABU7EWP5_9TELE|nr:hypothetical protein [Characodon lateralis]
MQTAVLLRFQQRNCVVYHADINCFKWAEMILGCLSPPLNIPELEWNHHLDLQVSLLQPADGPLSSVATPI